MSMPRNYLPCYCLFILTTLSIIGCRTGIRDSAYLSPATISSKQRHYEMGYETVFRAAYQAARKAGLRVAKADKQMGAIIASKHIGAYNSGWTERYAILLEAIGDYRTIVQVKCEPVREGAVYAPLSSVSSAQSTDWQTSTRKVNDLFDRIQKELGLNDIFGIRGLME
jgi:hypothetical protein